MKKILLIVIIVIFVPFLIVNSYKIQKVKEIRLNYESNYFIRVKRTSTNEIQNIPFEEYIVGVLAGEMPISFEKEAFKAQAVAARSYALKRILYNKDNDYDVVDSIMTRQPKYITAHILLVDALKKLKESRLNNYPVVDEELHVIGMLTWQMIIREGIAL